MRASFPSVRTIGWIPERITVSDTINETTTPTANGARRRTRGDGLSAMVLPELRSMAAGLGITGTARMPKGQLIEAIQAKQGGGGASGSQRRDSEPAGRTERTSTDAPSSASTSAPERQHEGGQDRRPQGDRPQGDRPQGDRPQGQYQRQGGQGGQGQGGQNRQGGQGQGQGGQSQGGQGGQNWRDDD